MKRKLEAESTLADTAAQSAASASSSLIAPAGRRLTKKEEEELRDRQRAKELETKFRDYKPVINLEYRDEFGRILNTKEAYKQLSYKFHGKQPGKLKTEKRLKRVAEEMALQRAENSSLKGVEALMERQRETGSAHLLLSVGSKGSLMPVFPENRPQKDNND
jgi:U4/U6.U5 tri-snRNP-associated protein 1